MKQLKQMLKKTYNATPDIFKKIMKKLVCVFWMMFIPLRYFHINKEEALPQLNHLPKTITAGIKDTIENYRINQKIKQDDYSKKLFLLTALPKSASSVIGDDIAYLMSNAIKTDGRKYASYMIGNQTSDLRLELVKDFKNGGVLKFHTKATGPNLSVLDVLRLKYFVLFRHPLDQISASYCDIQRHIRKGYVDLKASNLWYDQICLLEKDRINTNTGLEEGIDYLISEGYLMNVLSFITDWLRFRSKERSLVLKYEDFVGNDYHFYNSIAHFVNGQAIAQDIYDRFFEERKRKKPRSFVDETIYPKGHTAGIGIWKSYFSKGNLKNYKEVVNQFMKSYPGAAEISGVYPDLFSV